ncbi:MAG: response regulator [Marinifilaceae bacterium]|jgi:CheY-like chemotaxis protein|nr:response regulator [Marinifilaceae bacterium]
MNWGDKNYSILLVEDNVLNQTVVQFSLKKYGYSIDIANNGIEAIEKYNASQYDFILMDIMMPEMDGLEATKKIRDLEKDIHTPIIALTADVMVATAETCINTGMDAHMTKPFQLNNLFSVLEELKI